MGFLLANSVDPDETLHKAAFHLGLHCLPSTHLGVTVTSIKRAKQPVKAQMSLCSLIRPLAAHRHIHKV